MNHTVKKKLKEFEQQEIGEYKKWCHGYIVFESDLMKLTRNWFTKIDWITDIILNLIDKR